MEATLPVVVRGGRTAAVAARVADTVKVERSCPSMPHDRELRALSPPALTSARSPVRTHACCVRDGLLVLMGFGAVAPRSAICGSGVSWIRDEARSGQEVCYSCKRTTNLHFHSVSPEIAIATGERIFEASDLADFASILNLLINIRQSRCSSALARPCDGSASSRLLFMRTSAGDSFDRPRRRTAESISTMRPTSSD